MRRALLLALAVAVAFPAAAEELSLEEALRQAAAHNLDLVVARARLEQSRVNTRKAWAGYLPHLSAGGNYTRNSVEAEITLPKGFAIRDVGSPTSGEGPPGAPTTLVMVPTDVINLTVQKKNQLGAFAELRQNLLAPTLVATIVGSQKAEQMAELRYVHGRRELLFAVAQTWFGAAGLNETVSVQERLLQTFAAQVDHARVRVEAGAAPRIDLLRAEIDQARAEQDLVRTQIAYQSAKSSLGMLLGREPDFEVPASGRLGEVPAPPSEEEAAAQVESRPDIQAAKVQVDLATTGRRGAMAAYLPTMALAGQYRISNVEGFTGSADVWAVTVGLNWTLWDGGLREAQLREARASTVEAEASLEATRLRARDELRRALLEVESVRANREKAQRQVQLAQESLQLIRTAWEAGATTSLEVSTATSALLGAELSLLGEKVSAHLATLQVLKAAGAFDVTQ